MQKDTPVYKEQKKRHINGVKIIGIAGGNGKTTVAKLIRDLLMQNGFTVGLISHYEISMGHGHIEQNSPFINCEDFHIYINKMITNGINIIIVEFNFSYIDPFIIEQIELDTILYTPMDLRYNNTFGDSEEYIVLQKKALKSLCHNGIIIISSDDENSIQLLSGAANNMIITYGFDTKATITASSINISPMLEFYFCIQRGLTTRKQTEIEPMEFPICTNLLGEHNVYNLLAAITIALFYGAPADKLVADCKELNGPKRRLEWVRGNGYQMVDDIAHNQAGLSCVFKTINGMDYKDLHILIGIDSEDKMQTNINKAYSLYNEIEILDNINLITSCSMEFIDGENLYCNKNAMAFHNIFKKNNIRFRHEEYLKEAVKMLISFVKEGDLILLLGESGMDQAAALVKEGLKLK